MELQYPSSEARRLAVSVKVQTDAIAQEMDGLRAAIEGLGEPWESNGLARSRRIDVCILEMREAVNGYERSIPQEVQRVRRTEP